MSPKWPILTTFLTVICRGRAHTAINVKELNFTAFLEDQESDHGLLMEFYANWCPTCQHFQPDYEKVARYFNTEPKVQPGVVVARIDCATEVSISIQCFLCALHLYINVTDLAFRGVSPTSAHVQFLQILALQHPLCSKFKIARYPTLKYGLPGAYKEGSEIKLEEYLGQRKPKDIIEWVGQQKGVYALITIEDMNKPSGCAPQPSMSGTCHNRAH